MSKGLEAFNKFCDSVIACVNSGGISNIDLIAKEQVEKELKEGEKNKQALDIISQNFRLMGNCLHAKNKYAESGWVFVKELEDEEEHNAWKEVLL